MAFLLLLWGKRGTGWPRGWKFKFRTASEDSHLLLFLPFSDYAVLQDPYVHFKRPPLSSANLMAVESHSCGMNGGLVYLQNVRPEGPVSWLFHRTTEVPLRCVG